MLLFIKSKKHKLISIVIINVKKKTINLFIYSFIIFVDVLPLNISISILVCISRQFDIIYLIGFSILSGFFFDVVLFVMIVTSFMNFHFQFMWLGLWFHLRFNFKKCPQYFAVFFLLFFSFPKINTKCICVHQTKFIIFIYICIFVKCNVYKIRRNISL